jgi:hypothetical protein
MLVHYGFELEAPRVTEELSAWNDPPAFGATRDRSVLGSLRRVKDGAWHHFAYRNRSLPEAASRQWEGLYTHPSLPKRPVMGRTWRPIDLVAAHLMPGAILIEPTRERPE